MIECLATQSPGFELQNHRQTLARCAGSDSWVRFVGFLDGQWADMELVEMRVDDESIRFKRELDALRDCATQKTCKRIKDIIKSSVRGAKGST
jgi:hypothetical protein